MGTVKLNALVAGMPCLDTLGIGERLLWRMMLYMFQNYLTIRIKCTCVHRSHRPYLGKRLRKCKLHLTMKIDHLPGRSWSDFHRSCLISEQGPSQLLYL